MACRGASLLILYYNVYSYSYCLCLVRELVRGVEGPEHVALDETIVSACAELPSEVAAARALVVRKPRRRVSEELSRTRPRTFNV